MKVKSDNSRPRPIRAQIEPSRPSDQALERCRAGASRTNARATQVRRAFVNADYGTAPAPLSLIVRGGRAGRLRLQLMLGLLWMGGGGDKRHTVKFPARAWAELLDLPDAGGNGQRRVRDAVVWLESQRFIAVARPAGFPPVITLLREDGSGAPYVPPVTAPKDPATGKLGRQDWSFRLPSSFWSNSWVLTLSTAGLALLLIMLDLNRRDVPSIWISPEESRRRYGLSEDTWTRGVAELAAHGIVTVGRQPVNQAFGWKRVRNNYSLNIARLDHEPLWATAA